MNDDRGLRDPLLDRHLKALGARTRTPEALCAAVRRSAERPGAVLDRPAGVPETGRRPAFIERAWWLPHLAGMAMLLSLLIGLLRYVSLQTVARTLAAGFTPTSASPAVDGAVMALVAGLAVAGIAVLLRSARRTNSRGLCL
jgi:hypothetical protein